jgi:glycosyltransferase involved in cell wall biosynthesis
MPKLFGARLILDIHDMMPEFFASLKQKSINSLIVRLVIIQEQLSCRFADQIITVTDVWRERLISRGVPAEKVSVVMNVADERIFYPSKNNGKYSKDNNGLRLIYHGAFKEHYGMKELIKAVKLTSLEAPNIHLTLQGIGDYRDEMVRFVDELELHNQIQINAFVIPATELPALIRQADVGVVPNRNDIFTGDLLPTKMMEYVALDTPIIASKTRVISHYFDENMVQFFTPGDPDSLARSILHLIRHKDRLRDLKVNSRKFKDKYSWSSISKEYVKLVERLSGNMN